MSSVWVTKMSWDGKTFAALPWLKPYRVTEPALCHTYLLILRLCPHQENAGVVVMKRRGLWCVFRSAGFKRILAFKGAYRERFLSAFGLL